MEVEKKIRNRAGIRRAFRIELLLVIATIILANYIGSFFFFRLDLTSEKRYTLSPGTVEMLEDLEDIVYVKIYLEGELPYSFKRLQANTREMLDEFRVYAGENIQYEFINPSESDDRKTRNEIYKQLYNKGLTPTNLEEKDDEGKTSQQIIFPGAIISYRGNEVAVDLLRNTLNRSPEENLNASIEDLEYSLVSSIRKLKKEFGQRIAFLEGHGELEEIDVADITASLSEYFTVERIKIDKKINALSTRNDDSSGVRVVNKYELLIIAKPDSAFDEMDKYIIDQYVMYGGKILWLVDPVVAEIDSLAYLPEILSYIRDLNLTDQLFKYGVRVNPNLVQDIQCAIIPVNTAIAGAQPQFTPAGWPWFPLLLPNPENPISRNTNLVKGQFVSVVDTVGNKPAVKKTILLATSKYTKVLNAPVPIRLDIVRQQPNPAQYTKSFQPVAVLLEGVFESIYENRLTPEMYDSREIAFKGQSYPTAMIVIGDGDLIRNNIQRLGFEQNPYPLGYDRYTGETFGNKEFLLNSIYYLLDDKGFMSLRSREIKLRLLDKAKLDEGYLSWQMINTLIPVLSIVLMGIFFGFVRKKRNKRIA